jgi:hypothetical protein
MYPLKAKTGAGGWLLLESRRKLFIPLINLVLVFLLAYSAQSQELSSREKVTTDTVDVEILYASAYSGTDSAWLEVRMRNQVVVTGYHFIFNLGNPDIARFCQTGGGVLSIDSTGLMIPPSPNYQMLLRICLDVCCIPDSTTDRSSYIWLDDMSWLVGEGGYAIPFFFHRGELAVWWSMPGDANNDSLVDAGDIVFIVNYLFHEGTEPCVCEAADCNTDCLITAGDVVYLINYLYREGTAPNQGCISCPNHYCLWWDKNR